MLKIVYADIDKLSSEKEREIYSVLPLSRQKKADLYVYPSDRKLSLAASYLLHQELEKLGINDSSLETDLNGKPFIPDSDINISMSHSGNISFVAISDKKVGVDVQ